MESVFMVHLGLDREPAQPSALCYYYGRYDVEKGVRDIRAGRYHDGADGFVLYIPSRHSPGMAPPGCHAVTIYTVAPNTIQGADWEDRKEQYADHLVACAEKHVPGPRRRHADQGHRHAGRLPPPGASEAPLLRRHRPGEGPAEPELPNPDPEPVVRRIAERGRRRRAGRDERRPRVGEADGGVGHDDPSAADAGSAPRRVRGGLLKERSNVLVHRQSGGGRLEGNAAMEFGADADDYRPVVGLFGSLPRGEMRPVTEGVALGIDALGRRRIGVPVAGE